MTIMHDYDDVIRKPLKLHQIIRNYRKVFPLQTIFKNAKSLISRESEVK